MVIHVLDYVKQCYSNDDGEAIYDLINYHFRQQHRVTISFLDVDCVSTSFINSAFITLLDTYDFEYIKRNLNFIDSNRTINELIKRIFDFEVNQRNNNLMNV